MLRPSLQSTPNHIGMLCQFMYGHMTRIVDKLRSVQIPTHLSVGYDHLLHLHQDRLRADVPFRDYTLDDLLQLQHEYFFFISFVVDLALHDNQHSHILQAGFFIKVFSLLILFLKILAYGPYHFA